MLSQLPTDPMMLLCVINMKLRDQYGSLETLCEDLNIDIEDLISKLENIGYTYNPDTNRFN